MYYILIYMYCMSIMSSTYVTCLVITAHILLNINNVERMHGTRM